MTNSEDPTRGAGIVSYVNQEMPPWLVQARASIGQPEDVERIVTQILGVIKQTYAAMRKPGTPAEVRGEMFAGMLDAILVLGKGSSRPGHELVTGLPEQESDQFMGMLVGPEYLTIGEPRVPQEPSTVPVPPKPPRIALSEPMRRLWDGLWDGGLIHASWAGVEVMTVIETEPAGLKELAP